MVNIAEVREIDRARAAQLVAASLTGDPAMFDAVLDELAADPLRMLALHTLLRILAGDVAQAIVARQGEHSADAVRAILAGHRAAAAAEETP